MKIAYDDLKALVKEALVEILQEGLGNLLTSKSSRDEEEDEFEDIPSPKAKSTMAPKQQSMKAVSTPFNRQITAENKQKVPSLTSMYEAKTLQKMGDQLHKQKQSTNKNIVSRESINQMTDDPLMAQIFADTAKTTLNEQLEADKRGGNVMAGGDIASLTMNKSDPMDIFGDVAMNWEKMAFSSNDLVKKK
jgi:TorA maturation chaperone TorD